MIKIEDRDLPITVAQKLITGVRPVNNNPLLKAMAQALTNDPEAGETVDMFSDEELREIADYLIVYCEAHINGD
jgi:hypothetical protein